MDIEQMKRLKKSTEDEIGALITSFLAKTGLMLNGMDFRIVETSTLTSERREVEVELTLKL